MKGSFFILLYIGINEDNIDNSYVNFSL